VDTAKIVHEIDTEIARLTSARKILTGSNSRTRLTLNAEGAPAVRVVRTRRHHRLSPAGRRRLSELMKKRWAERKKAAARAK
jgi:hypothetical protein